ncbi:MAG: hypothetical protein OEU26_19970 [Candidatus Tectomicrobia bacterium]|nr:hypothetical protein [Candidatus Tectomicrobia bacterium]
MAQQMYKDIERLLDRSDQSGEFHRKLNQRLHHLDEYLDEEINARGGLKSRLQRLEVIYQQQQDRDHRRNAVLIGLSMAMVVQVALHWIIVAL